jgi:Uma2 family endonuclease
MIKKLLKFGPGDAGEPVSAEEFAAAEFEEPYTYERVRGRLVVMSPAGPDHRQTSRTFRRELCGYWHLHPDVVEDDHVEGLVATSSQDDRIPDICVYLFGSTGRVPHRVPDAIFEFVSHDRADQERDYIQKRAEYHAIRVKEYVIVDRFKETVLVLTWQPGDYAERVLQKDDDYTTPLMPGLRVRLSEVFA